MTTTDREPDSRAMRLALPILLAAPLVLIALFALWLCSGPVSALWLNASSTTEWLAGTLSIDPSWLEWTPVDRFKSMDFIAGDRDVLAFYDEQSVWRSVLPHAWVAGLLAGIMLVTAVWGAVVRTRRGLTMLRSAMVAGHLLCLYYLYIALDLTAPLSSFEAWPHDERAMNIFMIRWDLMWPAYVLLGLTIVLHVWAWRRQLIVCYDVPPPREVPIGDRIVENVRTHGADPRFRRSWYGSTFAHAMIIVIIPWLLSFGCTRKFGVPYGSGVPVVAMMKEQPKKKKKKKVLTNPQSAIDFRLPDLDDSQVEEEVATESEATYVANAKGVHGKLGQGGGTEGGWPDGMKDAAVEFVRWQHRGRDWDDGMAANERADLNFLDWFHKTYKFKVGREPVALTTRQIRTRQKGYSPAFLYVTGDSFRYGRDELDVIRDYIDEGGMLFGDAGHRRFHRDFVNFCNRLIPGKRMQPISTDDDIFRQPFEFPNGAPPMWHFGGNDNALGLKHKGRWVVFYHAGDLGDALETGGSGAPQKNIEAALAMVTNVVYYAFTNYLERSRKYRK